MENSEIDELLKKLSGLKIALAHDYLIKNGGAENCLVEFHSLFPNAPIYTLIYDSEATKNRYEGWDIRTSYLQKRPFVKKLINYYRLLMPQAVESFDFSEFDVVLSDASSFIKGIITGTKTKHICYMHTPTRFLWFDIDKHVNRAKFVGAVKGIVPFLLHRVRIWDVVSAERPDVVVANSNTAKERILKYYRRDCTVIHPPVNIEPNAYKQKKNNNYFLIVSRLEPHKDIDIAIKAASKSKQKLIIVGEGSDSNRLKSLSDENIEFLGHVSEKEKMNLYLGAKAFLAPQLEDFGITMVEALSFGCPVIARKAGGAIEIVEEDKTGILLDEVNESTLAEAMMSEKLLELKKEKCFESALKFSRNNFKLNFLKEIIRNVR